MVLVGGPIAWPFDVVLNLGSVNTQPDLRAPVDGRRRVVVLQHGLFRTPASMARLQRTLEAHGYEVLNPGYASTQDRIEAHAVRLQTAIQGSSAAAVDEWCFVGHSLGGLVIQEYLRSPGAVQPRAVVYLGTPHRGAMLADLRKHWFLYPLLMGTAAAMQLSPGDAFHRQRLPWPERTGAIVGDLGAGNAVIPGNDDGTVAVDEATFPGAVAITHVAAGHTKLTVADEVLRQVLQFLRHGGFAPTLEGR